MKKIKCFVNHFFFNSFEWIKKINLVIEKEELKSVLKLNEKSQSPQVYEKKKKKKINNANENP